MEPQYQEPWLETLAYSLDHADEYRPRHPDMPIQVTNVAELFGDPRVKDFIRRRLEKLIEEGKRADRS